MTHAFVADAQHKVAALELDLADTRPVRQTKTKKKHKVHQWMEKKKIQRQVAKTCSRNEYVLCVVIDVAVSCCRRQP